jgi:uncharacterized protein (TIGR02117 family)
MRRLIAALAWPVCVGSLTACAPVPPLPPADDGPRNHAVHVVNDGWHAAIVIPRPKLVATGLLPEAEDFPDAAFLEFGWGDRVYYPAKEKTLRMTLEAGLIATPAVMHMAGLVSAPELTYADSEVVPVALTERGFRHLVRAIAGDFERPEGGRAEPVSRGHYPNGNFYEARGTFHLLNTCNTWIARILRAGGVNLSPIGIITADELMARLRAAVGSNQLSGSLTSGRRLRSGRTGQPGINGESACPSDRTPARSSRRPRSKPCEHGARRSARMRFPVSP